MDLVYPPGLYCISCGKIIDGTRTYRLCNECMAASNWITERHCARCGKPLSDSDPGERCFSCKERDFSGIPQAFDKGHACAGYGACEQAIIFAFKYGSMSDIGDTLGEIMYDRMVSEYGADVLAGMYDLVIPVPVYKEKKKKRGFNHADLMAEAFAGRAGLRCLPDAVVRTRATAPMKGLGPEDRRANIRGAFRIRERLLPEISGARVLLIDDIYTTGATIDEIAGLLKKPHAFGNTGPSGEGQIIGSEPGPAEGCRSSGSKAEYMPRHLTRPKVMPGASRVDFLAYAGGRDMIGS